MAVSKSQATWEGTLKEGAGRFAVGNGHFEGPFTFASRFEGDTKVTNPEELIGAAHAGCFSMFLSALLTRAGFTPTRIQTNATVHLTEGPTISLIELDCSAEVPGLDQATFDEKVAAAKANCPVSKALAAVEVKLSAKLV
jgi:osmotically inducible protein OsmC